VNATRKHPDPLDPGRPPVSVPLILRLTFIGIPFLPRRRSALTPSHRKQY
jgi:hypothetical protein